MLKGIQQGMRLPAKAMLPSFAALRDYGNTSACRACAAAHAADLPPRFAAGQVTVIDIPP